MLGLEGLHPAVFLLNLVFVSVVTRGLYSRRQQNPHLMFSLMMFGVTIFLVVAVFARTEISLGFGFGLFAVFGILRYRAAATSTLDLTYLFVVVAMALINGLSNAPILSLAAVNLMVLAALAVAQSSVFAAPLGSIEVAFERVDLSPGGHHDELLREMRQRTGLDVQSLQVLEIDYVREITRLRLIYRPGLTSRNFAREE
jgi:hypothetical protein